jgi:hypothetical protein
MDAAFRKDEYLNFNSREAMPYLPNIPQPNDLLSESQGDILGNFQSANTTYGINHYPFDNATVGQIGKHKYVEMPVSAVIPAGLITNEGTVYSKTANAASQLFYSPDNSTNEYQLTRCIAASFSTFSTFTVFDGTQPRVTGGWTFLPGGLLIQYGIITSPVNGDIIKLPVAFSSFSIPTITSVRSNTNDKTISIQTGSITLSQFQITLSTTSLPTDMTWQVIGK